MNFLPITLNFPQEKFSSNGCSFILIQLVQHLLYIRQQIPSPIHELKKEIEIFEKKITEETESNYKMEENEIEEEMNELEYDDEENEEEQEFFSDFSSSPSKRNLSSRINEIDEIQQEEISPFDPQRKKRRFTHLKEKNLPSKSIALAIKRKHKSNIRKAKKVVENASILFEALNQAFLQNSGITSALIIFGTTILNPKESYILQFPKYSLDKPNSASIIDPKIEDCSKKLIRTLMTHQMQTKILPISKMFVLLQATSSFEEENFVSKHNFILKTSKVQPICLTFQFNQQTSTQIEFNSLNDQMLWFQANKSIKGYKLLM